MIELGITHDQLDTVKRMAAKSRQVWELMPTVTDDAVLDMFNELLNLCCQVEAIVRTVERQGS